MNIVNTRQGGDTQSLAIDCQNVRKSFGDHQVLKGIDLSLPYGSMLGLLGRNGAGKSTLISILTGLSRQSSGRALVCGVDVGRSRSGELGRVVGLAPQQLGLYPQLSAMENLVSFGMLQGLGGKRAHARAEELLAVFSLERQAGQKASRLSGGQQRRLHTAIALVHQPRLIFLDEPTVGADVDARARILEAVRAIAAQGTAVVYTSHYLDEFERLGADLAFLDGGRIVERGTQREVIARHAEAVIEATFEGGTQPDIPGWTVAGAHLERRYGKSGPGEALAQLTTVSNRLGLRLSDVKVTRASLENAYHHIINEPDSKGMHGVTTQANTITMGAGPTNPAGFEIHDGAGAGFAPNDDVANRTVNDSNGTVTTQTATTNRIADNTTKENN
ncbi:ABC transporter ATP-binding protein [Bifidobacterium sp. ESL0763]|uniref:ABC transporter ATP-binding protein n=1 Tax=Bifidobacterium sp. ESL0763 TaxID=2983227 RepID=UPI0023F9F079|nr:ABC transporter ATP-binding protein [Bifidobacterium sp. ESL0763]MDF7664214.1 ABC transporter ATP-binding protein [Bifidobacterium sp. ESL0763]